MSPRFPALLLAFCLAPAAGAQLSMPGTPVSARATLDPVPAVVLDAPDVQGLMLEDERNGNWPYRYGAVIPTDLSAGTAGVWEVQGDELVWRLRLSSPGALSLGLLFDRYELPESGRLFVYDQKRETVLGAFGRETRQPNGMLAVQPVAGDQLVVEYVQDAADPGQPDLRIGEVVHDYRGILERLREQPTIELGIGCWIDAKCPQAAAYQDIKRSVIMVIASGAQCSAAMINNTQNDGTPYFLTANHCGNQTNVLAVFDYERTGCGTGTSSTSKTISGATLLAANAQLDCQIYRLSSAPPESYDSYFAGWDRRQGHPGPALSFSHPQGNPRKFARDNDAPLRAPTRFAVDWEQGRLDGGSSGSPLFNSFGRVIGPACCVSTFNCTTQIAFYGNFGEFYDGHGLAQWLDPQAAGVDFVDGYDHFAGQTVPYNGTGINPELFSSVTPPTLGTTWTGQVDTSLFGPSIKTWTIGTLSPSSSIGASGELLINLATPRIFSSIVRAVDGVALHQSAIPNDPAFIGLVVYSQAYLFFGGGVLTNGLELHVR